MRIAGELFFDGGLRHNNPSMIAYHESRKFGLIDYLMSLGTGVVKHKQVKQHPGIFAPLSAVYQSILHMFDPESSWYEIQDLLHPDEYNRYHHLNIDLAEDEAAKLDDVAKMTDLKDTTMKILEADNHNLHLAANAILAGLFYFELDNYPKAMGNTFQCTGYIFCKVPGGLDIVTVRGLSFVLAGKLVNSSSVPRRWSLGDRMVFDMRDLSDEFSILVTNDVELQLNISGFPCSAQNLILAQGLPNLMPAGRKRKRTLTVHFKDSGTPSAKRRRAG
jgi:hypothetical protein